MEEKLSRYLKRAVSFICALVVFLSGICLTSFHSYASSDFDFVYNSAEPTCSEGQGYLALLMHNGNNYNTRLYSFMSSSVNADGAYMPAMSMISITSNRVVFNINTNSASNSVFHAVYYIAQSGNMTLVGASDDDTIEFTPTGGEIIGWQVYGNGYVASNTQNTSHYWSVIFRGGDAMNVYAMEIVDALNDFIFSNGENTDAINSKLDLLEQYLLDLHNESIYTNEQLEGIYSQVLALLDNSELILNSLDSLNTKTNNIFIEVESIRRQLGHLSNYVSMLLDEVKESNTWLEKIWNSIQEFLGLESEEEMEPLPDEEVGSVLEDESDLMQDTTDAENSLDFSVDSNSNNVVWNIIERVLNSNPRVFGAFIGIMTLGIITLLLNR